MWHIKAFTLPGREGNVWWNAYQLLPISIISILIVGMYVIEKYWYEMLLRQPPLDFNLFKYCMSVSCQCQICIGISQLADELRQQTFLHHQNSWIPFIITTLRKPPPRQAPKRARGCLPVHVSQKVGGCS